MDYAFVETNLLDGSLQAGGSGPSAIPLVPSPDSGGIPTRSVPRASPGVSRPCQPVAKPLGRLRCMRSSPSNTTTCIQNINGFNGHARAHADPAAVVTVARGVVVVFVDTDITFQSGTYEPLVRPLAARPVLEAAETALAIVAQGLGAVSRQLVCRLHEDACDRAPDIYVAHHQPHSRADHPGGRTQLGRARHVLDGGRRLGLGGYCVQRGNTRPVAEVADDNQGGHVPARG